ncbi:MAG: HNH endonuclease signature motif containing protein, partial [Nocardioidaceae bacterium]
ALGDPDGLQVRRGRAVGIIADPQTTLNLIDPAHDRAGTSAGTPPHVGGTATLYLHLDGADVGADSGVGHVERLGAATLDLLRGWLTGCATINVRPLLDLARTDAVDGATPPAWMRELVVLRDGHCVFPGCGRPARSCDLDHIDPYDDTGPPGQTRPDNLACLCRRHHRAKTHTSWRYRREADGRYHWTAPSGRHYTVSSQPIAPPRATA